MNGGLGSALRGSPAATKGRKRKKGAVTAQAVSGPAGGENTGNKLAMTLGLGAQAIMGAHQKHPFAMVGGMVAEQERGKAYGGALSALLAGEEPDKGQVEMLSPQQVDKLATVQMQLKKGKVADLSEIMKMAKGILDMGLPEDQQVTAIGNLFKMGGLSEPLTAAETFRKAKGAGDVAEDLIEAEGRVKKDVEGIKARSAKELAEIRVGWEQDLASLRAGTQIEIAEIRAAATRYGADKQTDRFMKELNRRFTADPETREKWATALKMVQIENQAQMVPDSEFFKQSLVNALKWVGLDDEAVGIAREAGIKAEGGAEEGGELSDNWLFEGLPSQAKKK